MLSREASPLSEKSSGSSVWKVALLATAVYFPTTLYPPSDLSHSIFRVATCLALAAGFAWPLQRLARWGVALWVAGIVWSVVVAPDPWRAVWSTHNRQEGAWQAAHYVALVLVLAAVPREKLARWVAVAALMAAAMPLWQSSLVDGRLAGSTGNPLYLAPLLLVGVWGAWRTGWNALAVILALAAIATGSKGVGVAAVAAFGVLVLSRWPRVGLGLGMILAGLIWVVPVPTSGMIRLELGRVALHGIATAPWGWGAEGFPFVWDIFWRGATATGEAWHDRAHNLLLDRTIEWGVVGVVGWLAVVVAAWRRAELPERMALAAWLAYHLTMFEMMWGAVGFAVLVGYRLRGPTVRVSALGYAAAALALVVGSAQLAQSAAGARAADIPAMQAAIEMWSPVGGDLVEVYLKGRQTRASLDWAAERTETRSPHATQQAMLLALWDPAYCADLKLAAPRRPDVRELCP